MTESHTHTRKHIQIQRKRSWLLEATLLGNAREAARGAWAPRSPPPSTPARIAGAHAADYPLHGAPSRTIRCHVVTNKQDQFACILLGGLSFALGARLGNSKLSGPESPETGVRPAERNRKCIPAILRRRVHIARGSWYGQGESNTLPETCDNLWQSRFAPNRDERLPTGVIRKPLSSGITPWPSAGKDR